MAVHTHFFWESLRHKQKEHITKPGLNTKRSIESDFESLDHMRAEFLSVADSLFGNGFVWLMKPRTQGGMTILATYNAGSPYSEAAPRRDNRDMAAYNGRMLASEALRQTPLNELERRINTTAEFGTAGSFGDHSNARANLFRGALDAQPILCVNVWQHQYIPDWGVLGKRAYLSAWWDAIDWEVVERRHSIFETENLSRGRPRHGGNSLLKNIERAASLDAR